MASVTSGIHLGSLVHDLPIGMLKSLVPIVFFAVLPIVLVMVGVFLFRLRRGPNNFK